MQHTILGHMPDGRPIEAWRLGGASGELSATILTYGARIADIAVPTPDGPRTVSLGLADAAAWLADRAHLGAVAGRTANRIAGGRFVLDGTPVQLATNSHGNTLHGGPAGFGLLPWTARADGQDAVVMALHSPDGDQGYPGALDLEVRYAVRGLTLELRTTARCDAPTVLNPTNHCYFNLDGAPDVLGHVLTVAADHVLPTDAAQIPTGQRLPVAGTPFDFRTPRRIGERIEDGHPQLRLAGGYDQCWVLADAPSDQPRLAARVAAGGLAMEVHTTEPGIQVYSGNNLKGDPFPRRSGLCLETQHFPDSPNHPDFPSIVLRPGQAFASCTRFAFSLE